jgi:L-threonylcarbamoyladenylate synthase
MPLLRVHPERPEPSVIEQAAAHLRAGGLVAFPTETVYGLGALALDEHAVARIYEAKGRPSFNPLIVHVADLAAARALAADWPEHAEQLARRLWPGPLTMVVPKRPNVPVLVTAGLSSVALRVPAHPVALALLEAAGAPVAAPSANRYQHISPTSADHVLRSLGDDELLVLDGGPCTVGIESTVVDLCGRTPRLLRPGGTPREDIEAVVGPLADAEAVADGVARPSPGMVERHYAPLAMVRIARGEELAAVCREVAGPVGVMAMAGGTSKAGSEHRLELPADAAGYASVLYASLHTLDALGCRSIVIEEVPDQPAWDAVRDRLVRAAA